MSLNWQLTDIKDYQTLCWVDGIDEDDGKPCKKLHHATNALIWITMGIGIGEITEGNWKEFYARCRIYEKLFGAFRSKKDEAVFFTEEEVKAHIGLHTNVFPKETVAKWSKRMIENAISEQMGYLKRREEENKEKAA